jgi:rSAM/selenodomain-associated transferase 1
VASLPLVLLFARWPRIGRVKTRLARRLGEEGALELHRAMLEDTRERLDRLRQAGRAETRLLWADGPPAGEELRARLSTRSDEGLQEGADLGGRLNRAIGDGLGKGHPSVLVLGSDSPTLPEKRLHEALASLEEADLVFGPCPDGGYYLVGARRPVPEVFRDIPWGGGEVLARSLEAARKAGASTRLLGEHADVDRPADLIALRAELSPAGSEAARLAPRTRAFLGALP